MTRAKKGWGNNNQTMYKLEAQNRAEINAGYGVVNTGLGRTEALHIFNNNIIKFETIKK